MIPLQVFISYSFQDKKIMNLLKNTLESNEIECYVAEHDYDFGNLLSSKLSNAIDSSNVVIAVITSNGSMSSSVNQEIGYAKKAGKHIIPLVEEGVPIPILLQGTEHVSFNRNTLENSCNKIIRFLNKKHSTSSDKNASHEEAFDENVMLRKDEYEIYTFDLDDKALFGEISSDMPIGVYVVNNSNLSRFEKEEDFNYVEGVTRTKRIKVHHKPTRPGRWHVIIDNLENDEVEVNVFLDEK